MVNFNDPATIALDSGAYTIPLGSEISIPDLPVGLSNRDGCEALAPYGWYIYVSLHVLPR
jgi:hypothetical protein